MVVKRTTSYQYFSVLSNPSKKLKRTDSSNKFKASGSNKWHQLIISRKLETQH